MALPAIHRTAAQALAPLAPDAPIERAAIEQVKRGFDLSANNARSVIAAYQSPHDAAVARFADTISKQVLTRDLGPLKEPLLKIREIAQNLDPQSLKEKGGLLGLFSSLKKRLLRFEAEFTSATTQVDTVVTIAQDRIADFDLSLAVLDRLFDEVEEHFYGLAAEITAFSELRDEARATLLPALEAESAQAQAANAPDAMARAQKIKDLKAVIDLLDRKVLNKQKARAIAYMQMPTIRQLQDDIITVGEELRMGLAEGVSAWKTSMAILIHQMKVKEGVELAAGMTDFTNQALKSMASALEENAVQVQEQTQRGIADADAIAEAIGTLVRSFDKVDQMIDAAQATRNQGRAVLSKAESDLRAALAG